MDSIIWLTYIVFGCLLGILGSMVLRARSSAKISEERTKSELQNFAHSVISESKNELLVLAEERLGRVTDQNRAELESRKQLIDERMNSFTQEISKMSDVVRQFEKNGAEKFGELSTGLKLFGTQTSSLTEVTSKLGEVLSSSQSRGQWGEKMAEDVLTMAGLVEGIQYTKQKRIEGGTQRPDFIFNLPEDKRLNMDVKFPLSNYMKFLEDEKNTSHRDSFLKDVRSHIDTVASREYIDPEGGTVDCVLLFIPNESVYSFILQSDNTVIDRASKKKVIVCSPLTLLGLLAVIRQSIDSFNLKKEGDNIISLMGRFNSEWTKFTASIQKVGDRLASAQKAYDELAGPRKKKLEKPLDKITDLLEEKHIPNTFETHIRELEGTEKVS
ncbi:MAG: recombinase RmuC [Chloroflexi bacterium]|nr:recombinase RmuC [Chloroflexota bacterium]|tara:strand:- start:517 stop:1671 length:1155 start_codon:yes stop_codon:yes gene_type:complete